MNKQKFAGNQLFFSLLILGGLFFWALWFSLAALTNFFDLLYHLNLLDPTWRFKSGNFALVAGVVHIYAVPSWITLLLFITNTIIQSACAILFWCSFMVVLFKSRKPTRYFYIHSAFLLSIGLWAIFIILDEFFIAYLYEGTHIMLLIFEFVSLLTIYYARDYKHIENKD